jgi:hypothetical protein
VALAAEEVHRLLGVDQPSRGLFQTVATKGVVGVGEIVVVVAPGGLLLLAHPAHEPHPVAELLGGEAVGGEHPQSEVVVLVEVREGQLQAYAGREAVDPVVATGVAGAAAPHVDPDRALLDRDHDLRVGPERLERVGRVAHGLEGAQGLGLQPREAHPHVGLAQRLPRLEAQRLLCARFCRALEARHPHRPDPALGHGQGEDPRRVVECPAHPGRRVPLEMVEGLQDPGHGLGRARQGLPNLEADRLLQVLPAVGGGALKDHLAERALRGRRGSGLR